MASISYMLSLYNILQIQTLSMELAASTTFNVIFPKYASLARMDKLETNEGIEEFIKNQLPLQVDMVKKLQGTFTSFLNQYSNLIVKRPQLANLSYSLASRATELIDKIFKDYEIKCQKMGKQGLNSCFQELHPRQCIQLFRNKLKDLQEQLRQKYTNNPSIPRDKQQQIAQLLYKILQIYHFMKSDLVTIASKHQLLDDKICGKAFNNGVTDVEELAGFVTVEGGFEDYINSIVQKRCRPFHSKKEFFSTKLRETSREADMRLQGRSDSNFIIFIQSLLSKQRNRITKMAIPKVQSILRNIGEVPQQAGCRDIMDRVQGLKRKFMEIKNNSYYIDIIRGDFARKYKMELDKLQNLYYLSNIEKYLQDVMGFLSQLLKTEEAILDNRKSFKQTLSLKVQQELQQLCSGGTSTINVSEIITQYFNELQSILYGIQNKPQQYAPTKYSHKNTQESQEHGRRVREQQQRINEEQRRRKAEQQAQQRRLRDQERKMADQSRRQRQKQEEQKRKQKILAEKAERQRKQQEKRKIEEEERKKRAEEMGKRQKQLQQKRKQEQEKKKVEEKQRREVEEQKKKQEAQRKKRQDEERRKKMEQLQRMKKEQDEKKRKDLEAKRKKDEEETAKRLQEQRKRKEHELQSKREEEERLKAKRIQQEERKRKQLQEKKRKEDQEKRKKQQQDKARELQQKKKKQQQDRKKREQQQEKKRKEAEQKRKKQQDDKIKRQLQEKKRRQQQQKRKAKEEEDRLKRQQEDQKKKREEQKKRKDEQERKKRQTEDKQRERKRRQEEQEMKRQEDERKRKQLQDKKKRQQEQKQQRQEKRKKQEEEKKRKEQQDRKKREAQQKKRKEEQQLHKKAEQQQKKKLAQQKQRKQKEQLKKKEEEAKAKKGGKNEPKKSAINYADLEDQLIDQGQDIKKPQKPLPEKSKKQDDQYLQDYDDDFDQFSPQKEEGHEGEQQGIKPQQLIMEQNLKCLNEYMKGTSYARKNKPNLEQFNNRNQYAYLFEEFTQNQKLYIYSDSSIAKAICDFGKELEDQNTPEENLKLTMETIQQALIEDHVKTINEQELRQDTRLIFPFSFKNDLGIYLVEVQRTEQAVMLIFVFKEPPGESQEQQMKIQTLIEAFRHIYSIEEPQIQSVVVPEQTKAVLDTLDKELPLLLLIFVLHYEQEHNLSSPVIVNQYTIERFFYISHTLKPLYDMIMNEEDKIDGFFSGLAEKYSKGPKLQTLMYQIDINEDQENYDAKISEVAHKFKQDFLGNKNTKHQFALIQLLNSSQDEQAAFSKIALYFNMNKQDAGKPTLNYFIVSANESEEQLASRLFEWVSGDLDDKFETNVYMDFTRHNGLTEYSEWSLSLWPHVVEKRKMNPLQAFRALTFAMAPYYIAVKQLD